MQQITVFVGKTRYSISEKRPKDPLYLVVTRENSDGIKDLFVPRQLFEDYACAKIERAVEEQSRNEVERLMGSVL